MKRREEAEINLQKALEICAQLPEPDPEIKAMCLFNLAYLYHYSFSRLSDAEPMYRQALDIREKELGPEDEETRKTAKNLISLLRAQAREKEAREFVARFGLE